MGNRSLKNRRTGKFLSLAWLGWKQDEREFQTSNPSILCKDHSYGGLTNDVLHDNPLPLAATSSHQCSHEYLQTIWPPRIQQWGELWNGLAPGRLLSHGALPELYRPKDEEPSLTPKDVFFRIYRKIYFHFGVPYFDTRTRNLWFKNFDSMY